MEAFSGEAVPETQVFEEYDNHGNLARGVYVNGLKQGRWITVWENGSIQAEEWYRDGKYHRVDAPAVTEYRRDGSIEWEQWYLDVQRNRADGPAIVTYREDGSIHFQEWYRAGNRTAFIEFIGGKVEREEWYENGERVFTWVRSGMDCGRF